jgi:hypothetical protein
MPKPYSEDLRDRVIDAVEKGEMSRRAAARRHGISESVAVKWLERVEREGSRAPVGHGGHRAPCGGRSGTSGRVSGFCRNTPPTSIRSSKSSPSSKPCGKRREREAASRVPSLRSNPHPIPARRMRRIPRERRICVNPNPEASRESEAKEFATQCVFVKLLLIDYFPLFLGLVEIGRFPLPTCPPRRCYGCLRRAPPPCGSPGPTRRPPPCRPPAIDPVPAGDRLNYRSWMLPARLRLPRLYER